MKLRIIATVLLVVALAGGILGAGILEKEYGAAQARYDEQFSQLQTLEEKAEALRQTLDSLTMDTAQARQDQADALSQEARTLSLTLKGFVTAELLWRYLMTRCVECSGSICVLR